MFKKFTLASLIIFSFSFSNSMALTCAPIWKNMAFQQAQVIEGGMATCFYSQNGSGWYKAAFENSRPIAGPWKYYGGSGYWCRAVASECVFEGEQSLKKYSEFFHFGG